MSGPRSRTSLAAGSLLREYREWAGYSRDALAKRVRISVDQLERWEIIGVRLPPSARFLALAGFLDIPASTIETALEGPEGVPTRYMPRDPIEVYEAAHILEEAIGVHGWTAEKVAKELSTSPTKVQAWRLGLLEMSPAERQTLSSLIQLRNEPTAE